MKQYLKNIIVIFFVLFSFYYTDKVIEISKYNDTILVSINEYASSKNYECREGSINEYGIVLGLSGLKVDKNKSYSNMKGIGFKKELIEYKENKCILNKEDNIDKYIIKGNDYNKNISLVINITNTKYYKNMINVSNNKDVELNLLFNYNDLSNEIDNITNHSNILFKGKTNEELNSFIKILHNEIYCVKINDFDIKKICSKKKLNSINKVFEIQDNLLNNVKNNIKNGTIFFISENSKNLKELSTTINYIQSKGYKIVTINELLK